MKSYSKGKEFEEIIEKVYKLIAKNERKNVKIEKNVLMIGKNNTKNEIDILLSYESFGTIYRVAIECKNWKKTIDVKELRNFAFKLELIENINGIFISANSDFQIGAKKVTEYKQIKLIKFNELNKIIDGLDSEYLIPTSKTIGDPFWMFMDKNGYNTIKQNYFLKEGILLFESKYFAKQFQKTYLNNRGKKIELVGVSQDHLKEIMYLKKKKNIKVRMFNTYFYILNEQCNCFFDLSIEDLQMYVR